MEKFNEEIARAIKDYPRPNPSPNFDARVLQTLREKQQERGFRAALMRFWQLEIEGVAVWRLAFSSLSGAAFCALALGVLLALSGEKPAPQLARETPRKPAFPSENLREFYAREWEFSPPPPREFPEKSQAEKSPSLRLFPFSVESQKEVSCVPHRSWA